MGAGGGKGARPCSPSREGGILDSLTFIPPVGSRPQVGSAWFLSCLKLRGGFFFFYFLPCCFWSWKPATPQTICFCFEPFLGPAYLPCPTCIFHRRGTRFKKKRGRKGEKNKIGLIRADKSSHLSIILFFFALFFWHSPLLPCLPWRCHQTGQMTPEPGSYQLRGSWKKCLHMCARDT